LIRRRRVPLSKEAAAAEAGEGASSNYAPGIYGDFGLAVPNAPGVQATAGLAAALDLKARIIDPTTGQPAALRADAESAFASLTWTSEPFLGGLQFAAGVTVPYVRTRVAATVDFGIFGVLGQRDETDGFGDVILTPAALYGVLPVTDTVDLYLSLSEFVTAPTGRFFPNRLAPPGRGHWSFDTVAAASWIDETAGYEIGLAGGVLANPRNRDTDYLSGAEAHLDLVANVALGGGFIVGATVYGMAQLEADSGTGAGPDPIKGRLWGAGLQAFWTPDEDAYSPSIRLKWLHDFDAQDRFAGDYVYLTVDFPL